MKRIVIGITLVLIGNITCAQTGSSFCNPDVTPVDIKAIAYKDFGTRCEGYFRANNSGVSVNLISFTSSDFEYQLSETGSIQLAKAAGIFTDYLVKAVAVSVYTNYRMDTRLTSTTTVNWPMDYCLFPKELSADKLGIYGYNTERGNKKYFPVNINNSPEQEYTLKFRSLYPIDKLIIQINSVDNVKLKNYEKEISLPKHRILKGKPIEIRLKDFYPNVNEATAMQIILKPGNGDKWGNPSEFNLVFAEKD